jgi:uncharacterized membrane protein
MAEQTPAQQEDKTQIVIGVILSGIVTWLAYTYLLAPWFRLFGGSNTWGVFIAIFIFFVGVGSYVQAYNKSSFFARANQKLAAGEPKVAEQSATDRLKSLKELKDSGAITKKEFDTKKKELLSKV